MREVPRSACGSAAIVTAVGLLSLRSTHGRQSLACSFPCGRGRVGVSFRPLDRLVSRKLDMLVLLGFVQQWLCDKYGKVE